VVEQTNAKVLVKPTVQFMAGANSAQVRYPISPNPQYNQIYEVQTAVSTPTWLVLPEGERLAAPLALPGVIAAGAQASAGDEGGEQGRWVVGYPKTQQGEDSQEVVVIRPLVAPQTQLTGMLFKSGRLLFLKLIAQEDGAMLSVTWDAPKPVQPTLVALEQRPPVLHYERLFRQYTVEVKGAVPPPWMPASVLDDGTKTLIRFLENPRFTRAPIVTALDQAAKPRLVQSRLFVPAPQAGAVGAILVVAGIHPALELKDSSGLAVRIVRGDVRAPLVQGGPRHGY
jgi:type IV secretory pathway VirB9-like protein